MYHLTVFNALSDKGYPVGMNIVKSYPFKEQCYAWLYNHGYVYGSRYGDSIDNRFIIYEGE